MKLNMSAKEKLKILLKSGMLNALMILCWFALPHKNYWLLGVLVLILAFTVYKTTIGVLKDIKRRRI